MSKHVHVSNTLIIDDDGHYVASTTNCYESEQTNSANAQRIAACLNALAGLNPEAVPDVVAALRALLEGYERLLAQSVLDVNPGANRYSIAARAALAAMGAPEKEATP